VSFARIARFPAGWVAAALLCTLAACGSGPRQTTTAVQHGAVPPPENVAPGLIDPPPVRARGGSGLDRFVAAVQEKLPGVALDRRDEEVEELGRQACASLTAGKKTATVAGELRGLGVGDADAHELIAVARKTACPA